jgi:transcriptional regulator with XRE-family HTH domain
MTDSAPGIRPCADPLASPASALVRSARHASAREATTQPDQELAPKMWLGLELRRLRLELGMSQRKLTQLLGLSAHSNLSDYERGRRIPPADIVNACERLLAAPPGYLEELRRLALRERTRERLRTDVPGWPSGLSDLGYCSQHRSCP